MALASPVLIELPALADLLDLQAVDLEIDRLLERRQGLPELDAYRSTNASRVDAEAKRDALAGELKTIELDLDKGEGELELLELKLSESETRLFAGGMSAKETEHKRLEVRSLRAQQEALEERVLALLDKTDEQRIKVEAAQAEVDSLAAQERELGSVIAAEWKVIDAEVGRREARKAEIVPLIPEDLLSVYEKLRVTKEGVAVGALENDQCGGCHLHLSPSEQEEARDTDPPRCVHCRRILVL